MYPACNQGTAKNVYRVGRKEQKRNVAKMERKPGHLTKSVQEIAGSLFWIKVTLFISECI